MTFEDWHTHNSLCRHASGSLEDYIKKALEMNLNVIGFSDHFPYEFLREPFPSIRDIPYQEYGMTLNEVEYYLSSLEKLKEKYITQIQVKIAFERDFFHNQEEILNSHFSRFSDRLDYVLGSVHVLSGRNGLFAFDDNRFLNMYEEYKSNDEIYTEYYNTMQKMLNSKDFSIDIITHFDLPKKFYKLPENKNFVMNEAIKILELIKKKDLTIDAGLF